MTDNNLTFEAGVTLPDGRSIYVSIEVPAGFPDAREHAEIAQMAASCALGVIERGNKAREQRSREEFIKSVFER